MKFVKVSGDVLSHLFCLGLGIFLLYPLALQAALEQSFDVLQIGTTTYRNVTVTTKSKNYVFLLHSQGMTNIKVSDLSADERTKLGYEIAPSPQTNTNIAAAWARQTLTKIEVPQVKQLETGLARWVQSLPASKLALPPMTGNTLLILGAGLLGLYLLHCYCCMLICRKSGAEPGVLVWLPLLQLLPLLKAARMSPFWFLAFLVPGLNLLAQVLWCIKITQARGKSFWVAFLLIFPLSSPFAALYLAFSGSGSARKERRRIEIMTLEAA